jgi:hypothetical protein
MEQKEEVQLVDMVSALMKTQVFDISSLLAKGKHQLICPEQQCLYYENYYYLGIDHFS